MSLVNDTILAYLPPKRKKTPSGWTSFNAVCCQHNGNSADNRQRGGIMFNEGMSYHCFNCGFKASWQPGRTVSSKLRKFMKWLNVPDDLITKCSLDALRLKEDVNYERKDNPVPKFIDKLLPQESQLVKDQLDDPDVVPVLEYLATRGLYLDDFDWYWSNTTGFKNRLIVPFYHENRLVGYTARILRDGKPKYISEQQPGYVFNLDRQLDSRRYVIVTEGPFDAISIDGVALLGAEINEYQKVLIDKLGKEVILVPDRDQSGPRTVEQALQYGWSVSFPEWDDCKDVNDAYIKYGRLYTLYSIINNKESNALKIQLTAKKWFKEK
jgi:hypothetical protein